MKDGDKFYKVEALVSKIDLDELSKLRKQMFSSKSSILFDAIKTHGIEVYEISVHSASARIQPENITLDVSGNGESTSKKGFKRHDIEHERATAPTKKR